MKTRERQRHNRKIKEQLLSLRDSCGVIDPTPHEAVKELIREFKRRNEIQRPERKSNPNNIEDSSH